MLKGSREGGEVFAFDALRCDNSHALAHHSGRRGCGEGRIKANNEMTAKVPAGELSVLQLEQGIRFQAILCKKKRSKMKAVCRASWHSKLGGHPGTHPSEHHRMGRCQYPASPDRGG